MAPPKNKPNCKACKTIRYFLMSVIPLIFFIGTNQEFKLPGWNFHALVGDLFLVIFLVVLGWRVRKDFWLKRKN